MDPRVERIMTAAEYVAAKLGGAKPVAGIVLGSGLDPWIPYFNSYRTQGKFYRWRAWWQVRDCDAGTLPLL